MNNVTPDLFPAGTRVKNAAGHTGTVNGWYRQSISVKWDEGGSQSFPGWHGGLSLLGSITCSTCGTTKDDPALSWNTTTAFCDNCKERANIANTPAETALYGALEGMSAYEATMIFAEWLSTQPGVEEASRGDVVSYIVTADHRRDYDVHVSLQDVDPETGQTL